MKKIILLFILALSTPILGQKYSPLENYLDSVNIHHLASGSVEIYTNNEILFKRQFGNLDQTTALTENSKFRIGSISKTFTATMILMAVQENKISLKTKLSTFFPEIKNAKKITIHHLLNHTSGIFNYTNDSLFWNTNQEDFSRSKMIAQFQNYPSQFKPGEKHEYSNSGYFLLGMILEEIYKTDYATLLNEKITTPLSLTHTYEGNLLNANKNEAKSVYYSYLDEKWKENQITHSSQLMGAGGILSTPHELNLFYDALLSGKLINPKMINAMKTMTFGYGYGIIKLPYHERSLLGHTGGIDNFSSVTTYNTEDSTCFSITLNGYQMEMNNILLAMLDTHYKDTITKYPNGIKAVKVSPEKLESMAGEYSNKPYKLKLITTINEEEQTLKIKLNNQPIITLIPTAENTFELPIVDAKFIFQVEKKKVILFQKGSKIEFIKQ